MLSVQEPDRARTASDRYVKCRPVGLLLEFSAGVQPGHGRDSSSARDRRRANG